MSVWWIPIAILLAVAIVAVAWLVDEARASAVERDSNDRLRALTEAADKEVSRRPRVRAGSLPTVTTTTLKGKS